MTHTIPKRIRRFVASGSVFALTAIGFLSTSAAVERPVDFVNDVLPIMTKASCNQGSCHAKANGGQNGFQLSILGFDPVADYEGMVKEK